MAIGFWGYKKLRAGSKMIFWLVVFSFLTESLSRVFWLYKQPNLFISHFSSIIEFILISAAFSHMLKGLMRKNVIASITILFCTISILNSIFIQPINTNNSYAKTLEYLIIIAFTILYFYKLSKDISILRLELDSYFWFNSGALFYYSGSLFIFLYSNYILKYSVDLGLRIWFIHALFLMIYNICLSISLWMGRKK